MAGPNDEATRARNKDSASKGKSESFFNPVLVFIKAIIGHRTTGASYNTYQTISRFISIVVGRLQFIS